MKAAFLIISAFMLLTGLTCIFIDGFSFSESETTTYVNQCHQMGGVAVSINDNRICIRRDTLIL